MNDKSMVFMVVDDDSQVRTIIVEYLQSFGYTNIVEARHGKEALKMIFDYSQRIDVVISDWEMP